MAEAVAFSLASKILSAIASPAIKMAYEKGVSIWEARDELAKLQVSVKTIQAVLLDAEKKQEGSNVVKEWIQRLKGVLYDAEDLFDEVFTEDLLKQQMMEGKNKLSLKNQVRVSCSKLNPIISRISIAARVKAIRKNLDEISKDMAQFQFVRCPNEKPIFNMGRGEDRGSFVDAESVIGRDKDKETMVKMLINEPDSSKSNKPIVLAIVGIGGMGKTTLAQLIYNDEEIRNNFKNIWFACISDIFHEREVLGKIFQSIRGESCSELDVGQLQSKIRESIKDKKYLLILDDLWEDDRTRWQDRMSLLNSHASESRIIVTTRSPLVAKAVGALRPHNLEGLSEDDSWSLFKMSAFEEVYQNDPRRESLGKEIMKKCNGVPLALRSIGSLLYSKNSIAEWEAIQREDLPALGRNYDDKTMSVLKLSYDHLPSNLKHCFAYCCLFPKDYVFSKWGLINHWSAQGYIDQNDIESGFSHLLRRGFFQEAKEGKCGEIENCKMHDLMHDLAIYVSGEESVAVSNASLCTASCVRHVSFEIPNSDKSWDVSTLVHNAKSIRSLLVTGSWFTDGSVQLDRIFASFKLLRTLSLPNLNIRNIPPSIGELKSMRHLDLSYNPFEELPHSIACLVNLLSLNVEGCWSFKVWPLNFHKLHNLRYLNAGNCGSLRSMPIGIGEMTHLHYLSEYKIDTESGLHASARFPEQLRGKLSIEVLGDTEVDWDDCNWQLPVSLQQLEIFDFGGMRMPGWGDCRRASSLTHLELIRCTKVKYLPSFRCLPSLRLLLLVGLDELEFMEEVEEDGSEFFPCLEDLSLHGLVNLRRWRRKVATRVTLVEFSRLRQLKVIGCPRVEFESFPLYPQVEVLTLENERTKRWSYQPYPPHEENIVISRTKWQLSLKSVQDLRIIRCPTLQSLQVASPHLQKMHIQKCDELLRIELVLPQHLQDVTIRSCEELKSIELVEAQTPTSSRLSIDYCPELEILRASAQLIADLELLQIAHCPKLRLATSILPSPIPLHLGGSSWRVEVDDSELVEKLSCLPIQDVAISWCTMPIMFPAAPLPSVRHLAIRYADGLEKLQLGAMPLLQVVHIMNCVSLTSVEVEAPFCIHISGCPGLKNLHIANPNAIKEILIEACPELEELQGLRAQPFSPIRDFVCRQGITVQRISEEPGSGSYIG